MLFRSISSYIVENHRKWDQYLPALRREATHRERMGWRVSEELESMSKGVKHKGESGLMRKTVG